MPRLIHDRYLANGGDAAWDLATGQMVPKTEIAATASGDEPPLASLIEVLDHGREGVPRWIVADVRRGSALAAALDRAAADAAARGYVPVSVDIYARRHEQLGEALADRALLLLATTATPLTRARAALVAAAATSPRPHVLLTIRGGRESLVREAGAVYGAAAWPLARRTPHPDDVARQLARAARAREYLEEGSHAAAERLLRDVAGALRRRDAAAAEGAVLLSLGVLLLERGRTADAERVYRDAANAGERTGDEELALDGRIGQAIARIEARQLTAAESMCRALLITTELPPDTRAIVNALLARVFLGQGRAGEAAALDLALRTDGPLDWRGAMAEENAVRVLLAGGRLFEAGQRARAALARSKAADPPHLADAIAARTHLHVIVATGDPVLIEAACREALAAAKRARAPLHALRAYLLWADALAQAERTRELACVQRVLRRTRKAASPMLRSEVDAHLSRSTRPPAALRPAPAADETRVFVQISHEREDDRDAVVATLERIASGLQASRVDLWSSDAGPATPIASAGSGAVTTLGSRVLDVGIRIGPEPPDGHEVGVPVRLGSTLIAALAARWPADRVVPDAAASVLDVAAAVVAPRVERLHASAREATVAATVVPELIGVSDAMNAVRAAIARAAAAPFSVLIEGESGVGKELVARAIHQLSARRERRFCDLNCAALPDDLLDAELFGHARGAFTGAVTDRAGLVEEADGGTLFLDELADLSPRAQAKLLRVLQEHEVRRIGEGFGRKVDVRIVTAANRDMREEAAAGRFRQDLLYRLDVIRIRIPPLRERPSDIGVLAAHFWREAAQRVSCRAVLTHGVLSALTAYAWPGNVRELQNVMAALAVAAPAGGRVPAALLPAAIAGTALRSCSTLADARRQFERRFIEAALARAGGRRSRAARELGLSRQGLLKLLARLGMVDREGGR